MCEKTLHYRFKSLIRLNSSSGVPFRGVLFTGLMLTKSGPKVLEYNVRFGDPETQSTLPLLETDLAEILWACCHGCLDAVTLKLKPLYAVTVVVAAGGYPGSYQKGTEIKLGNVPDGENSYLCAPPFFFCHKMNTFPDLRCPKALCYFTPEQHLPMND